MANPYGIKEFQLHDDLQAELNEILNKLPKGTYAGTATDLHNDIVAISTGVQPAGATTSNSPTGTGVASWLFAGGGTYTNYGGLVIPANHIGFIIRDGSNDFSYISFELDLSEYARREDVVFKNELVIGKNKFNKNTTTDGKFMDENGNINTLAGFCFSDYIEVKESFHYVSNNSLRFVTQFNKLKQPIIGAGSTFAYSFSTTDQTKYVVVALEGLELKQTTQIEEGYAITAYENYRNAISPYSNRIACPKKQHFLTTIENNIYLDEFQKRKLPTTVMKVDSWPVAYRKNDIIRAVNPAVGTYSINNALVDLDYVDVQRKNFSIVVNDLSKTTPVKVLSVGDSYTDIGWYVKKMGQTIPNVTHLGTCKTVAGTDVNREGRSGWKLTYYLRNINSAGNSNVFSPFLHPIDPYKYYGTTAFWQKCYIGTAPSYEIDAWIPWVTTLNINSSGVRATPNVNDVMWFTNDDAYKVWNGTAWAVISENALNFTFNFAKYLSTWNIATPDIVTTLLGMNDFRSENLSTFDTFFNSWKIDMDFFISKIKEAVPAIKIVICTCNSTEYNEADGYSNAAIWAGYEKVIEAYDDRESEQIYISDTKVAVDRVWGYGGAFSKPFDLYAGSNTIWTTGGDVHLLDHGMAQIGQKLAATIQHIRP